MDRVGIAIEVDAVSYRYGSEGPLALEDVHLSVSAGEFLAVTGANGSGKSTLALLLDGLLVPTAGRVLVDGLNTADGSVRAQLRQRIGVVFQNPDNQIIAPSVEDDVAFGPENLGLPTDRIVERVRWALDVVGLSPYRSADPQTLSGGQRQRVAVAGVLAMDVPCLCFDEATSLLDPVGRAEVLMAAGEVRRTGRTIVWITHDMEEAAIADRVVVLGGGVLRAIGPPGVVLANRGILERWGLEPPPAVAIAHRLRDGGMPVPMVHQRSDLVSAVRSLLTGR